MVVGDPTAQGGRRRLGAEREPCLRGGFWCLGWSTPVSTESRRPTAHLAADAVRAVGAPRKQGRYSKETC